MSRLIFLVLITLIFSLGLVMIFSTTSADVLDHDLEKSAYHALLKQIAFGLAGIFLGCIVYFIGYQTLLEITPILFFFITLLLALTLIPGLGKVVNGSRRWLGIGSFTFQPSEFMKVFLPLFFIQQLERIDVNRFSSFFFKALICFIPVLLVFFEPNNGTVGVMGLTLSVVCFLAKVPSRFWATPLIVCALIGGGIATQLPYVTARLNVYLNPELDIQGKGHQPHQAKIAAGSGRLFGKGPGNGWQKLSYLPEAQNDYIAAIFAEEFGFLGVLFLIFCYMFFIYCGFVIGWHAKDAIGMQVAGALTFLIAIQAFLNMGVVSGLLPTTGLNLPFFSQGGTSLVANCLAVSVLLSIAKERSHSKRRFI
jgi:cell division protein FtsW